MTKKSKKAAFIAAIVLILTTVFLASCGSPDTIEQYMNKNPQFKEQLEDQMLSQDAKMISKGNTVTFEYTFEKGTIPEGEEDSIKANLKEMIDREGNVFQETADSFQEQTKIDGIKVKIVYKNHEGDILYLKTYKASEKND